MYIDPILKKYADLITGACGDIKMVYFGEPTRVPASSLPCIFISKANTEARNFTNAQDEQSIAITVSLVTDIRKELSTSENDEQLIAGVAKLYEIMEGRNSDYTLKTNTILDVLRKQNLVDAANNLRTDIAGITRVDYGETLRQRNPEEWNIIAQVQFVAHFVQIR